MPDFKDHFSQHSRKYNKFRPRYPAELYLYLSETCRGHQLAWDCATGNGQAAQGLAGHFNQVVATDASEKQISNAISDICRTGNISFRVAPAHHSGLPAATVDLITVAQALHWFDLDAFYTEVRRLLKPQGILAVWSYNLLRIDRDIDHVIDGFNADIIGDYWPAERQFVRDEYKSIAFPFQEVKPPKFTMTVKWSLDQLQGYLATWSSVQACRAATGHDPLQEIHRELSTVWGGRSVKKNIDFPLNLRVGHMPRTFSVQQPDGSGTCRQRSGT